VPAADFTSLNNLPALPPAAPLAEKIDRARAVLRAVLAQTGGENGQGVAVAFTGGKDSTVSLALWREVLQHGNREALQNSKPEALENINGGGTQHHESGASLHIDREALQNIDGEALRHVDRKPLQDVERGAPQNGHATSSAAPILAISVDTGLKFPQVTAFRDRLCAEWGVALAIARPDLDISAYPVAQDKLACCRDLKILPLAKAICESGTHTLLTGLRRDEHPSRALRPYAEWRAATEDTPAYWQVNPILDWTEMDVWAFITGEALPYCELYHEGYRSLGCMPCTRPAGADADERAGRDPEKERQLDILKGLGYF